VSARARRTLTKAAGVDGLGQIPDDWDVVALRHLLAFENGQVDPRLEPHASMALIAPNHIESGTGRLLDVESAREQGAISGKYRVRVGDIVYSKIRPALRKVAISDCHCLCSADMYSLRPFGRGESRFFLWSLLSDYFSKTVVLESERVAMPKVNRESLGAVRLLRPPLEEQTQIARFLDYETARIDALIEKQQQLIALLKEKRQAVISHAVTKGLNPNAPLRDSGVEWLGMVPAHWEVVPIRHALRIDNGPRLPINREERAKIAGPYPYWGPTGVLDHIDYYRYEGERVLIGEDGDHFLKFAIWPMTHWASGKFNVNNHAHVIATGRKCSARWFYYSFLHRDIGADVIAQGVSRLKLTREGLSKLILAVPPVHEQLSLIAHLEPIVAKVEAATAKAERQIELLQERRTALISAAVTGKIDVRGWKPPNSNLEQDVA
jgi:type I restriction enzyme, S subunit